MGNTRQDDNICQPLYLRLPSGLSDNAAPEKSMPMVPSGYHSHERRQGPHGGHEGRKTCQLQSKHSKVFLIQKTQK